MELIILISVTILLYAFLRSHGGQGVGIKGQFASSSTLEGKRDRAIALILVAMTVAAVINMLISDRWNGRLLTIIAPLLIGMPAFIFSYLKKKNKQK